MPDISFNRKDYNLKRIESSYPLQNYILANSYRVYGLLQEDNPLVLVEHKGSLGVEELKKFFSQNNIQVEFVPVPNNSMKVKYAIGLRKDLRDHIALCGAIISTIIAYSEGKLKIDLKEKLVGIPRFNQ